MRLRVIILTIGLMSGFTILVSTPAPIVVRAQPQASKTPFVSNPPTKTPIPDNPPTKSSDLTNLPTAAPTAPRLPTQTSTSTSTPPVPTQPPTLTSVPTQPPTLTSVPTLRPNNTPVSSVSVSAPSIGLITTTTSISAALPAVASNTEVPPRLPNDSGNNPPSLASESAPVPPIVTQALNASGFILGLGVLGVFIWLGLTQLSRSIIAEVRGVSLANLRIQHEAERVARRDKVVFRLDADVLTLLDQAILDATGETVHVRLMANKLLLAPPMAAVTDEINIHYIFSPVPPDQMRSLRRHHPLAQFIFGRTGSVTAYPLDALNSTPFIADDLCAAFTYLMTRFQTPRRPLPRTDRWYVYVAQPQRSRWPRLFASHAGHHTGQTKPLAPLKAVSDRLRLGTQITATQSKTDKTIEEKE